VTRLAVRTPAGGWWEAAGRRAWAGAVAIVADRLVGEPPVPDAWHPVGVHGRAVDRLARRLHADRVGPGVVLAAANLAGAAAAGRVVRSAALAGWVSTSGRALHAAALDVAAALEDDDLDRARALLPMLVGRDPTALDAGGVARAAVESVAENTVDAVVAPVLWAVVGGAAGAFVHRAGDSLDSMVGYRDERYRRFGTAAARADDVLAWVPARATALLVAAARPARAAEVARTVRRDAPAHPSPNAGVAEAAFAAALGLRLGGTNRYGDVVEDRAVLGDGKPPTTPDVRAAVALSRDVGALLAATLAAAGTAALAVGRARARRQDLSRGSGARG
jgi:adenosylcobinamide-phosphate synthase